MCPEGGPPGKTRPERGDQEAVARRRANWLAGGALLLVVLIWGINVPFTKVALREMHPFAFNAVRIPLSALLLGVIALVERRRTGAVPPAPGTLLRVVFVGLLGSLLYQALYIVGLDFTSAGNMGFIIATGPLWTALIARTLGVERIKRAAWVGLTVAFVGASTIIFEGGTVDLARSALRGNLLAVAATIIWAVSTVASKPLLQRISATYFAFWFTASMVPFHVLLGAPHLGPLWRLEWSALAWGAILFSGLMSSGLAYLLWYFGVRHVGPSHTAVYTTLVPVITLAGGVWIVGESVTPWQIGGGVLVLGGLTLMQRARAA